MNIDVIGRSGQTVREGAIACVDFGREPTAAQLEQLDELASANGASRVSRTDIGVYWLWPGNRMLRPPCGGCGVVAPVGKVCGCQAKPKRSACDHETERCTPEVRARLGLG